MFMPHRDHQALLVQKDLPENQVLKDPEVMMVNQVMMVIKENRDSKAFPESVSISQDLLVSLEKRETKDNQEELVLPVKMVLLDHKDLKENAADMLHQASQVQTANLENQVKMVNQESQEYLV